MLVAPRDLGALPRRPVSLRVVNDLVQLRSKDDVEFGPVRYQGPSRYGLTPKAELINGRIAMAAITIASALSYTQGRFVQDVLAGKLPFSDWF